MTQTATCDFCQSNNLVEVYKVPNSLYQVRVFVCGNCGLTQSIKGKEKSPKKQRGASSGANFGNLRVGKGLRFASIKLFLTENLNFKTIKTILDIGSNRGDFLLWISNNYPKIILTGIEPDTTVIGEYRKLPKLNLLKKRYEKVKLPANHFDFIFCSHTLEHADSAQEMLMSLVQQAKMGGYIFLEVPNVEIIGESDIVEEFFIDKHTFHFHPDVLLPYLGKCGFKIVANKTDVSNITLLCQKNKEIKQPVIVSTNSKLAKEQEKLISEYIKTLATNRNKLKAISAKLYEFMGRQKVVFWGAGRIFDALVRYGELKTDRLAGLIDSFLSKQVPEFHGVKVSAPNILRMIEPQVVVILAKSSALAIEKEVRSYGIRHVIKFSDLITNL